MTAPSVIVVGAGPAGLMAAEVLSGAGLAVTVYDAMPSVGRKLLMAGRGGLNLTHSEPLVAFLPRYGEAEVRLRSAIERFPPEALRAWANDLGQATFIGSSGRVFPRTMKASPLLRAWLRRLAEQGVQIATRHRWTGWDASGRLTFRRGDGSENAAAADAAVLALGGASWPKLGSDGGWVDMLAQAGVPVAPLRPANCGFVAAWSSAFGERFAGTPLNTVSVSHGGRTQRGAAMITKDGIEGGAIYALSAALREAISRNGSATIYIDLRPDIPSDDLARRIACARRGESLANILRKAGKLQPVAIHLLRESIGPALLREPARLAALIKAAPITLSAPQAIVRAISTAGGIRWGSIDENYMLRAHPGLFAAGEMLDWEAPTGGYLLQACFATGAAVARGVIRWLSRRSEPPGS